MYYPVHRKNLGFPLHGNACFFPEASCCSIAYIYIYIYLKEKDVSLSVVPQAMQDCPPDVGLWAETLLHSGYIHKVITSHLMTSFTAPSISFLSHYEFFF